jgi:hypothetical protein
MPHRSRIVVTVVLMACAVPASVASAQQDLRPPDARDAAEHRGFYEVGDARARTIDRTNGPYVLGRDYGSPDSADAGRYIPRGPVVLVRAGDGGFGWGDAGIGAAGMLALLAIATGSAALLTQRRRRRAFRVATR